MAPEVAAVERTGGYDQMVSLCSDTAPVYNLFEGLFMCRNKGSY